MEDWGKNYDLSGKYSVEWKVNRIDKHGGDFLTFGEKDQVHSAPVTYSYADPRGEKDESIKIVIVGAPGVGKTAIAQQFSTGHYDSSYYPTSKRETYNPSVILNDKTYQLRIVDIPDIPMLPTNSFYNISDLNAYGLRDAHAYVLVYDLLNPESFEYITNLFHQISECRDLTHVPVVVVGNKVDKVNCTGNSSATYQPYSLTGSAHSKTGSQYYTSSKYRSSASSSHKGKHKSKHDDFGGGGHHGGGHHDMFGGGHHGGHFGDHGGFGHHDHHGGGFGSHGHHDDHHGGFGSHHDQHHHYDDHHDRKHHKKHKNGHSRYQRHKFVLTFEENEYIEKDIAEKVTAEWKAIYRESTVHNGDSVTAIFKAALQFIHGEGKAVFKEFEKDEGPPKLCVIL